MRNAKCAMLEDSGTQKGSQRSRGQVDIRWVGRRWIWEGLERLISAEAVANEKDQSFGRCSLLRDPIRLHAMDNGTDKVYVEDGVQVDQVENDGQGQKPPAADSSHSCANSRQGVTRVRYSCCIHQIKEQPWPCCAR